MARTYIKDLKSKIGTEVLIKGFVQTVRDQGGIKFLIMRDVTDTVQVVVLKANKDVFDFVKEIPTESVVEVTGLVKEEKQAPTGFEVQANTIKLLSKADPELPIPILAFKSGDETEISKRLDWRWLDLRKPEGLTLIKVWTALEEGFRDYFLTNGFLQIYAPSFMNAPSESGSEVFEVQYFDRKAYLAQSPQFYKQMAMASGFEKVFMVGPVFRAEPSFTTRHMTEFTGWDFEVSYIESHQDVMDVLEGAIVAGFRKLVEKTGIQVAVPTQPFPRITMADAKAKLKTAGVKSERSYDVSPEEEKELCRLIKEETDHDFVFLTDYPIEIRPFYHMRHLDNLKLTKSFDLMYRGVEITTGAQREHRYEVLKAQAVEKGLDPEGITDYLNFFRYGCPPHGGVGIGPGRIMMKILDIPSVKEATFLPRDVKRLNP